MGENECGKSGHLSTFTSLKHLKLMNAFWSAIFQDIILRPYQDTDSICTAMQLRSFLSGNIHLLLNNAFILSLN